MKKVQTLAKAGKRAVKVHSKKKGTLEIAFDHIEDWISKMGETFPGGREAYRAKFLGDMRDADAKAADNLFQGDIERLMKAAILDREITITIPVKLRMSHWLVIMQEGWKACGKNMVWIDGHNPAMRVPDGGPVVALGRSASELLRQRILYYETAKGGAQ